MGAPPGVIVDFEAFKWDDGSPWWEHRPIIRPTTQVVHTNAASRESTVQGQVNWSNAGIRSNTHAHYNVNNPQPTKHLPTDRRGIGNSSLYTVEREAGVPDCSWWSLVIETGDAGWRLDPAISDFLPGHAEIVARILAYESIVWEIPLAYPSKWTDPGTITHTEPFPYPYFTIRDGKSCPGDKKKRTVREQILPRARQIRASWLQEEETMYRFIRIEGNADQHLVIPVSADTKRRMNAENAPVLVVSSSATKAELDSFFGYEQTEL